MVVRGGYCNGIGCHFASAKDIAPVGQGLLYQAFGFVGSESVAVLMLVCAAGTVSPFVRVGSVVVPFGGDTGLLSVRHHSSIRIGSGGRNPWCDSDVCIPVDGSHVSGNAFMGDQQSFTDAYWYFCKEKRKIIWHFEKKSVSL